MENPIKEKLRELISDFDIERSKVNKLITSARKVYIQDSLRSIVAQFNNSTKKIVSLLDNFQNYHFDLEKYENDEENEIDVTNEELKNLAVYYKDEEKISCPECEGNVTFLKAVKYKDKNDEDIEGDLYECVTCDYKFVMVDEDGDYIEINNNPESAACLDVVPEKLMTEYAELVQQMETNRTEAFKNPSNRSIIDTYKYFGKKREKVHNKILDILKAKKNDSKDIQLQIRIGEMLKRGNE